MIQLTSFSSAYILLLTRVDTENDVEHRECT